MPNNSAWLSMLGVVVVFVLILILAYWCTRFVAGSRFFRSMGRMQLNERLRILDQLQMGKDQRLVVVQVGARFLALGITAQNISVLAELTGAEAEEWLRETDEVKGSQPPDFRQALMDVLQSRKKR